MIRNAQVVSFPVAALNYERAVGAVMEDLEAGRGGYVCVANVHMVMEAHDDPAFAEVVEGSRFTTSDGMPLVWMLRAQGLKEAERVYGPSLTLELCASAAREGLPIGLFGGTEQSLDDFRAVLGERYPDLDVVCAISPPFRPLMAEEDAQYTARLRESGARLIFVGIGCPRQERWMAEHTSRLPNAMLFGVGAAFDFHSGRVRQSPPILQRMGLEWAFRLVMEPRRLWKRYVIHNPRFVLLALWQLIRRRARSTASARKVQKTAS